MEEFQLLEVMYCQALNRTNTKQSIIFLKLFAKNRSDSIHILFKDTGLKRMLLIHMLIYWIINLLSAKPVNLILLVI